MPSGKELIRLNSVAHLLNQLAAGTLAGQPNAAGTQAAQNVAAAEEGIQGGLAQGKQKAMEEEMKKKQKKDLLGSIVGSVVGTAASAIPVVGPVVGPMAGAAAKGAVSGEGIDPGQVVAAGVGGGVNMAANSLAATPATPAAPQGTATAENSFYDPTTGNFVPAPTAPTAAPQQPATPTSQVPVPAASNTQPNPSTPAAGPPQASTPAPAPPSGEQQAVQAATSAVQAPQLASIPAPPAPPALPTTPPVAPENPNSPPPMGLGQRIARALVSPTGQSITASVQQFLAADRGTTEVPSVYAPGLNPETSMAIDREFAARAESAAARQLQEEQLGLQREGLGLDKNRLQLDKERLAQEAAANEAMRVLEGGKLALDTYQAGASAVSAENTNKLNLYNTQLDRQTSVEQMATQERIAQAGDATQLKAASISAGASLQAARLSAGAQKEAATENRRFQAAMANMQSIKPTVTTDGTIVLTGTQLNPTTLEQTFVTEEVPGQTPEIRARLAAMQKDERWAAASSQIMSTALAASKSSITGELDMDKFNSILPNIAKQYGILTGLDEGASAPGSAQTPVAAPNPQAAARTEANDAKLQALKTGQAQQKGNTVVKDPAVNDLSMELLLGNILNPRTLSKEDQATLNGDIVKPNR